MARDLRAIYAAATLAEAEQALERDAVRYRWLRDADSALCVYLHKGLADYGATGVCDLGEILTGSYADTAIDAAIAR